MEYKTFKIGFRKAGGKDYQIQVTAVSIEQALRIVSRKLSGKLGEGNFYIIGEAENKNK